ncbi:hypothetical protein ACX841_33350, partial [Burkholderia pseudomallei]
MTQLRSPKRLPGDCPAIARRLAGDRPAIFRPSVNAPLFAKARPLKYLEPLSPARGPASRPAASRRRCARAPLASVHPLSDR